MLWPCLSSPVGRKSFKLQLSAYLWVPYFATVPEIAHFSSCSSVYCQFLSTNPQRQEGNSSTVVERKWCDSSLLQEVDSTACTTNCIEELTCSLSWPPTCYPDWQGLTHFEGTDVLPVYTRAEAVGVTQGTGITTGSAIHYPGEVHGSQDWWNRSQSFCAKVNRDELVVHEQTGVHASKSQSGPPPTIDSVRWGMQSFQGQMICRRFGSEEFEGCILVAWNQMEGIP